MNLKEKIKLLILMIYATVKRGFMAISMEGLKFLHDKRAMAAATDFTAPVMVVIAGIIWVIMTPILVDQVQNTNTTGWSFTGYAGAITLFQLIPFVFIAGGIVWILKKVL